MVEPKGLVRRGARALVVVGLVLAACSPERGRPDPAAPSSATVAGSSAVPPLTADDTGAGEPSTTSGAVASTIGERPRFVGRPVVSVGDDWSLPDWVRPAANSGFFSESAAPDLGIDVRSVDLTWRQIAEPGTTGRAQGMDFAPLATQLAETGPFWMRLFASGVDWAPAGLAERCGVTPIGPDYDGQMHLPIWDGCVWTSLLDAYRTLLITDGLLTNPNLQFIYVPGAFTWVEYDYDIIGNAVANGTLDWPTYRSWYTRMLDDLATLAGDNVHKLVFTGEDYPFGPFDANDDLLAREAVDRGMGVRTGITELSNFHLSEAPAYGSSITPTGHLTIDETLHDGRRVFATENECFNDCGFTTTEPYYAIRHSNLKALQLQMNWMYVVPSASYLKAYPEHWKWVRMSLGQTVSSSPDAWVALRDAEDRYWAEDSTVDWPTRPWIRNLERWITQVDHPGCVAHRSDVDVHSGLFDADNGAAHEGLSTDIASGDTGLCFEIDPRFTSSGAMAIKVTYLDSGRGSYRIRLGDLTSAPIERGNTGEWKTVTLDVDGAPLSDLVRAGAPAAAMPQVLDLRLDPGSDDLVVRFVRVIRVEAP